MREAFGSGALPPEASEQIEQLRDGVPAFELRSAVRDLDDESVRVRGELAAIAEVEALVEEPRRSLPELG